MAIWNTERIHVIVYLLDTGIWKGIRSYAKLFYRTNISFWLYNGMTTMCYIDSLLYSNMGWKIGQCFLMGRNWIGIMHSMLSVRFALNIELNFPQCYFRLLIECYVWKSLLYSEAIFVGNSVSFHLLVASCWFHWWR